MAITRPQYCQYSGSVSILPGNVNVGHLDEWSGANVGCDQVRGRVNNLWPLAAGPESTPTLMTVYMGISQTS